MSKHFDDSEKKKRNNFNRKKPQNQVQGGAAICRDQRGEDSCGIETDQLISAASIAPVVIITISHCTISFSTWDSNLSCTQSLHYTLSWLRTVALDLLINITNTGLERVALERVSSMKSLKNK